MTTNDVATFHTRNRNQILKNYNSRFPADRFRRTRPWPSLQKGNLAAGRNKRVTRPHLFVEYDGAYHLETSFGCFGHFRIAIDRIGHLGDEEVLAR